MEQKNLLFQLTDTDCSLLDLIRIKMFYFNNFWDTQEFFKKKIILKESTTNI